MIASTLKAGGRVVAGARLAQRRHDVTLVDRPGFVGHRVDVFAGFLAAKRHVLLNNICY